MDLGKVLKKENHELQEILFVIREEVLKALRPSDEVILDDVDLRALLKISERTTAALRGKNMIAYSKLDAPINLTMSGRSKLTTFFGGEDCKFSYVSSK